MRTNKHKFSTSHQDCANESMITEHQNICTIYAMDDIECTEARVVNETHPKIHARSPDPVDAVACSIR